MNNAYTGPQYANGTIQQALNAAGLRYEALDEDALVKCAAEIVAQGDVLGWFQGRMEWGPRALGNRSIIADPRRDDMKDILNARIKHREKFRPFAPSILLEATGDYFDQTYPDPFMIKVYNVLPDKQRGNPGGDARRWHRPLADRGATAYPAVLVTDQRLRRTDRDSGDPEHLVQRE